MLCVSVLQWRIYRAISNALFVTTSVCHTCARPAQLHLSCDQLVECYTAGSRLHGSIVTFAAV